MSTIQDEIRECGRCHATTRDYLLLANTTAVLCRSCERAWLLSPESRRLRAISATLLSEWIERERCEALAAFQNRAFGVEVTAVEPKKESTNNDGRTDDAGAGSKGSNEGEGSSSA